MREWRATFLGAKVWFGQEFAGNLAISHSRIQEEFIGDLAISHSRVHMIAHANEHLIPSRPIGQEETMSLKLYIRNLSGERERER